MPTATVSSARPAVDFKVGMPIPPMTPHAVSVSLPRWQDNVDYEEGRLGDVMQTGYPRFFIHKSIQKLARNLLAKFGQTGSLDVEAEDCILLPSKRVADSCRSFMQDQHERQGKGALPVRSVQVCIVLPAAPGQATPAADESGPSSMDSSWSSLQPPSENGNCDDTSSESTRLSIYVALFPRSAFPLAKSFWQHTGDGISSRMADACLDLLQRTGKLTDTNGTSQNSNGAPSAPSTVTASNLGTTGDKSAAETVTASPSANMSTRSYSRNRHYARGNSAASLQNIMGTSTASLPVSGELAEAEALSNDHSTYVEERYGRNMARVEAPRAKQALRKRIAGVASDDVVSAAAADHSKTPAASSQSTSAAAGPDVADRAGEPLSEDDVYLYPTGMSAIFHAHQLALSVQKEKSVCFGFPYLDTLKILEKWGPGCFFLGHGDEADLSNLEKLLAGGQKISSLFCEFPSNPLLRSPDLQRLRALADQYHFLIVVDETVGNFVNVQVLPYADIVVSSLTKIFTGEANGMGGALVLNRNGPYYTKLSECQAKHYEDNFFDQNAIFLERNSRDFVRRVHRINHNALALVESLCAFKKDRFANVVKNVYYPTLNSRENYDVCKREPDGGYGGLFSLTFHSPRAAEAFYDALACAKGPSLGTNFTLASPFVILAHYTELDWAAQFGVEANLVRVSVGLEDSEQLIAMFDDALRAAQRATGSG